MQFVPIILGLVVIILAALVIRSMLGVKGDYEISFSLRASWWEKPLPLL